MTHSTFSYHHLRYFLMVAEKGSMTAAADATGVTQPTVSAQIAELERDLGTRLFRRRGNRLELTDGGKIAQRYAAEIFSLGTSLTDALAGARGAAPLRLVVGISDSLPLLTAHRTLEPALSLPPESVRLVLRVDKTDRLLAGLSARTLDIALTDTPVGPTSPVRAHTRLLAESEVSIFGTRSLLASLSGPAPESLDGARFLLHTENTPLRRGLDGWFARMGIHPVVAAEVEDVALLQILGQTGRGFFAAPSVVEGPIQERYRVEVVCRAAGVLEAIYGVTLDAEPDHPAVRAIFSGADLRGRR